MAKRLWIVALTAACAHAPRPAATPAGISCDSDCWNRAVVWIANHSFERLSVTTGEVLETEGFSNRSSGLMGQDISSKYGPYSFQATRRGGKVSMIARGTSHCPPIGDEVRAAFYKFVATGEDVLSGSVRPASRQLCVK